MAPHQRGAQRTLDRKQPPPVQDLHVHRALPAHPRRRIPLAELLPDPGEVARAAGGVGDGVVRVVCVLGEHQVVDDAAPLVEEDGEGGGVGLERGEGGGGEPFEEGGCGGAAVAGWGVRGVMEAMWVYYGWRVYFVWTMCPTSNSPALVRTWLWLATGLL